MDLTDEELLPAWDQVLEEFATALVRLHIACGAPPRSALAKQVDKGDRCRLPASTLSEVFNGKSRFRGTISPCPALRRPATPP